jgi:hypothetical protein
MGARSGEEDKAKACDKAHGQTLNEEAICWFSSRLTGK